MAATAKELRSPLRGRVAPGPRLNKNSWRWYRGASKSGDAWSLGLARAHLERIPRPAIGTPWTAETWRAFPPPPGGDGDRRPAGGGVVPPPRPEPAHVSTGQRTGRADLAPQILPGKPRRPASRLAGVTGDAGLTRAAQGEREGLRAGRRPGIQASSRPGRAVGARGAAGRVRGQLSKWVSRWTWRQLAPDLGKPRGETQSLLCTRLTALQDLASVPPLRAQTPGFLHSRVGGPERQTVGPANGRTQSVNFVFARHSQPMCARSSGVPPSVSGAPFWQRRDEPCLSPCCVWLRYFSGTYLHLF